MNIEFVLYCHWWAWPEKLRNVGDHVTKGNYFHIGLKISVAYDPSAPSMTLKTIGDTTSPSTSSEIISWSFRNTAKVTDFHAEITWLSGDTDAVKGIVQKEPGMYQYSFSILHNEQRQLGFDVDLSYQYSQQVLTST